MLYPTIKQYIDAIRLAEDNFDQLAAYRLVTGADGNPIMSSGNYAVVFKMQDICDGSFHAVKCFLKDQPGRAEAYHLIADELEQVTSSYLAHIRFLERELFVDTGNGGDEYPVLVMDWMEGITLDRYLRQHLDDPYALGMLAYHFARLGAWLLTQPFAHGDLKPDNILVRPDGTLVLVDYDGMYVPAMQGQKALETGTPDFRHPLRTDADFNEHIDDFPLASIQLSLRAVAYCPDYLNCYGATDRLLLTDADYRRPDQCAFLHNEFPSPDVELNRIYALFLLALSERTLSQVSFRLFNLQKPIPEVYTAPANEEEIAEGVKDAYGVVYSRDGKELLDCQNENTSHYHVDVRDGCQVIRGEAFRGCRGLISITLPDGLTHIGDNAFLGCYNLPAITLPDSLTHIGEGAFSDCRKLTDITLPASLTHIGDGAFVITGIRNVISHSPFFTFSDGCLIGKQNHKLIAFFSDQEHIVLPDGLTHIGDLAFFECEKLTAITLPNGLTHIGDRAFLGCIKLTDITLPVGLTHIGDSAFLRCEKLTDITLPVGLTHIGDWAFSGCGNLTSIALPTSLTHIGNWAFMLCNNLTSIALPTSLTHIGDGAFLFCINLTTIILSASLTHIGDRLFGGCYNLSHIYIPNGMRAHFEALIEPEYHSIIVEAKPGINWITFNADIPLA